MAFPAISTGSPPKPRPSGARALAALVLAGALAGAGTASAEPKLLPPAEAFRFSARALDDRTVEARFEVADGYYLYRDKTAFFLEPKAVGMDAPTLPPGKVKEDAFFGTVETWRGAVLMRLPLAASAAGQSLVLVSDSQGCADAGVCYPAFRQKVTLAMPAAGTGPGAFVDAFPRKKNWFN